MCQVPGQGLEGRKAEREAVCLGLNMPISAPWLRIKTDRRSASQPASQSVSQSARPVDQAQRANEYSSIGRDNEGLIHVLPHARDLTTWQPGWDILVLRKDDGHMQRDGYKLRSAMQVKMGPPTGTCASDAREVEYLAALDTYPRWP